MKVSKFWNSMKTGLLICMAAGWWGFLYPQLTLNADTYRVVTEDGREVSCEEADSKADGTVMYIEMLNADRSRLRFRCRLVEEIMEYLERVL